MEYNIYLVDSFTNKTFKGNPAGVIPDAKGLSEKQMQNIARELNAPETAFVTSVDKENYNIRSFTPYEEVKFYGNSILATFYMLALKGYISPIELGIKTIYIISNRKKLRVDIYFSNYKIEKIVVKMGTPEDIGIVENKNEFLKDLGLSLDDINIDGRFGEIPIVKMGYKYALIPIKEKEKLDNLKLNKCNLKLKLEEQNIDGVHLFYLPEINSDTVFTRSFPMTMDLNEESGTASANGALIYILKKKGLIKDNKVRAIQGETISRESSIYCVIKEEEGKYEVEVGGKAKVIMEGIIHV